MAEEITDLYEDGLRYTDIHSDATGVACVAIDDGNQIHLGVVAVIVEDDNGRPITPARLAAVPEEHQTRISTWVALRVCMHARAEVERSMADRNAP
jgi:hypothetical protein